MKLKLLLTGLLLMLTSLLFAQVSFTGKVSKQQIGMNERLKVVFEMNQDGDNFNPPNFNGFSVSSGPSQSVSRSWVNGTKSYSKSYTYFVNPTKVGTFQIGQATIEIKGQTYKTSPIRIKVTSAVANPTEGVSPDYVANKSLHLVATVSNKNPYLNEAVTLEYRLYWDPEIGISSPQETDTPKFRDFWSQNIEIKELKAQNGTYKGKPSAYVVWKKVVLYPQKTGALKITPLSMSVPVQVPTNRRDIFGRRLTNTVNKAVSAGRTVINVKPLPANAPESFNGAVGQFSFRATQTKQSLNATESLQVKLQVNGTGNLKLFKLPELKVPNSIEVYDPEHTENVRTNLSGMKGRLVDTYTLVPQFKGSFPIPKVNFTYFDPKLNSYKTLNSGNLSINVLEGPNQTASVKTNSPNTAIAEKQQVVQENASFKFIKTQANLEPIQVTSFFKTNLFWLLLILPLLVIPIVVLFTKRNEAFANDLEGNKARKANKLVKKYLSTAKKNLGDSTNFYLALEKALHNYLKAKLGIETNEMNKERIKELLANKSVDKDTVSKYISLLESCEMSRYTPMTLQNMEQDYAKASEAIAQIDKQL